MITKIDNSLRKIVRIHAYIVTIGFVSYMFVVTATGMIDLYQGLYDLAVGVITTQERAEMGISVLRNLAFTIVLYKGFTVLFSYAKTTHINTKLILELAIIAPIVELIFNFHSLETEGRIIYAAFAVAISFVYFYGYEKMK